MPAGDDLGGGVGIGAAELTGGDQDTLVHAHGHQLTQHTLGGRGTHGEGHDLAAQLVLQGQSASTAFISSGLMMVCMDARSRVPSGFTATLPEDREPASQ